MDSGTHDGIADELRRGAPTAMDSLVAMFHAPLYRFFLCDGADRLVAEDLTAETFVRLIESFQRFRGDDSQVRAFVYATARHVLTRHWQRRSRHDVSLDGATDVQDSQSLPIDRIVNSEQCDRLFHAIGQLPDIVREIVLLRYVEDLSLQEIAMTLEIPQGTVKSHLHRGRQRLKILLIQVHGES